MLCRSHYCISDRYANVSIFLIQFANELTIKFKYFFFDFKLSKKKVFFFAK